MKDQHFKMTDVMIEHDPTALDWAICQNTRKLVEMSGDFSVNSIAANAMLAFIGHACETESGDILMYSVDAYNGDEDTCIFITNRCENPQLRDRAVIPNHRYVLFVNAGEVYELHYVSGTKVPNALPGMAFQMLDKDPTHL